jgi:hypothetical protein
MLLQQQSLKTASRQSAQRTCHVQLKCATPFVNTRKAVFMSAAATEASPVSSNGKVGWHLIVQQQHLFAAT